MAIISCSGSTSIFTARVRSTGRYCFHRCLSVHRGGRGGGSSQGGVRSSRGGGVGQVQPEGRGGSGPARGEGWVRSSWGGGVGHVRSLCVTVVWRVLGTAKTVTRVP